MPTFKEAAFYVENGVTYYFKDKTARDLLKKCYSPSNPPPATEGGRIWYATCSTAAGTAAKVATSTTGDFVLATGAMVRVKFANTNNQTQPTLSIDGSVGKRIKNLPSDNNINTQWWRAGEVIDMVYDGADFIMSDGGQASTGYYGKTILSNSTSSTSQTTAATSKAVKDVADAKVDRAGDTMTGNLIVTKAGDTYVEAVNSNTGCRVELDSTTGGASGVWSSGYNDGTYHASPKWLVRRKTDGSVEVDGNCTGTADNVTGTVAIANGGTGATTAAGARGNIGAVNIAGDTMTGNLTVQKPTGCWVGAESSNYGTSVSLTIANPSHGVYSEGYYDGSVFHSDAKWMIYRNGSGDVIVNGKCLGTAANVTGTVAIANGGTGATDSASALAALGGCPIVTTDISGNSSATFTISNSGRGVLVLIGAAVRGMYLVNATSSGGISYSSVLAATGATLNTSTNNRLTVSVTGYVTAAFLTISNTIGLV